MLTERGIKKLEEKLNGNGEQFIRDAFNLGLGFAKHYYHMDDVSLLDIEEYIKIKKGEAPRYDKGLIRNPYESPDYADDILSAFLRKLNEKDKRILELEEEVARLTLTNKYLRTFPLEKYNEKLNEILK